MRISYYYTCYVQANVVCRKFRLQNIVSDKVKSVRKSFAVADKFEIAIRDSFGPQKDFDLLVRVSSARSDMEMDERIFLRT